MGMFQSGVAFLGRAMLSIIFISSGVNKMFDWQATLLMFNQALTDWLAISIGSPLLQSLLEWALAYSTPLLVCGMIFEVLGGLSVFLGLWTRFGAVLLVLFMIPTTLLFHAFWNVQGPERAMQMISFMTNVSITGGLLFVAAMGKRGKCSSGNVSKPKSD